MYPNGEVRVHSEDPKPMIRVKPDAASRYQRYGFVDAVLGLDPVGKLGLKASDFKVMTQLFNEDCFRSEFDVITVVVFALKWMFTYYLILLLSV